MAYTSYPVQLYNNKTKKIVAAPTTALRTLRSKKGARVEALSEQFKSSTMIESRESSWTVTMLNDDGKLWEKYDGIDKADHQTMLFSSRHQMLRYVCAKLWLRHLKLLIFLYSAQVSYSIMFSSISNDCHPKQQRPKNSEERVRPPLCNYYDLWRSLTPTRNWLVPALLYWYHPSREGAQNDVNITTVTRKRNKPLHFACFAWSLFLSRDLSWYMRYNIVKLSRPPQQYQEPRIH